MLFKKKPAWQGLALWALVFSGVVFAVARFFMHAVNNDSKKNGKAQKKYSKAGKSDELFI